MKRMRPHGLSRRSATQRIVRVEHVCGLAWRRRPIYIVCIEGLAPSETFLRAAKIVS